MLCNLQICFEFSSYLSSVDYQFNSIVIWEPALYNICSSLLKCVLWPRTWPILVNNPCQFEKYVYSAAVFVRSLSRVQLFATPWTAACQASLSITHSGVCSNSHPLSQWCHQPSHPLLSPSPPAFSLSQHQVLFQWISSSHQLAEVLELQHQSFQWIFKVDFLLDRLVGSPCSPRDSQEFSPTPQFKGISSSVLSLFCCLALTSVHDYWKNHSFDYMDFCQQSNVSAF